MNHLQPLNLFPTAKADIRLYADNISREILDGDADPVIAWVRLKAMEEICNQVMKQIKDYATTEAEKYGEMFEKLGARLEVVPTGVKYDYSTCGDPTWNDLTEKIQVLDAKRKAQENFLKAITDRTADPDTGAIIYPPAKTGGRSIKVTFK